MNLKNFFKLFFKSTFGAATIACTLLITLFITIFISWIIGIVSGLLFFLLIVLLGLFTRIGIHSALKTHEAETWMTIEARLVNLEQTIRTIKVMRINDEELSKIIHQIAFRAEKYVAVCRQNKTYEPAVTYEIEQVPELIDALLNELDETTIEARFKLADQHVFPFARDRVLAELERISRKIEHASLSIAHDSLPAEKLERKEFL